MTVVSGNNKVFQYFSTSAKSLQEACSDRNNAVVKTSLSNADYFNLYAKDGGDNDDDDSDTPRPSRSSSASSSLAVPFKSKRNRSGMHNSLEPSRSPAHPESLLEDEEPKDRKRKKGAVNGRYERANNGPSSDTSDSNTKKRKRDLSVMIPHSTSTSGATSPIVGIPSTSSSSSMGTPTSIKYPGLNLAASNTPSASAGGLRGSSGNILDMFDKGLPRMSPGNLSASALSGDRALLPRPHSPRVISSPATSGVIPSPNDVKFAIPFSANSNDLRNLSTYTNSPRGWGHHQSRHSPSALPQSPWESPCGFPNTPAPYRDNRHFLSPQQHNNMQGGQHHTTQQNSQYGQHGGGGQSMIQHQSGLQGYAQQG